MKIEKAIILRTIKHGESDLIVHALNREGARVNLMAKGALRSRRRFGGGILEPLNYLQLSYKVRSSAGSEEALHWLEEAQLIKGFQGLRVDYDRLEMGFYLLQRVSQVCKESSPDNQELFDLLGNSLEALQSSQNIKYLRLLFEIRLLHQQGVLDHNSEGSQLARWNMGHHEKISLSEDEFSSAKREINRLLEDYLNP